MNRSTAIVASTMIALLGAACGPDENPPTATPTPVFTSVPTSTTTAVPATSTPTPTPTPFPPHVEVVVASDEAGGGALVPHFEFEGSIPLYFSQCFGGQGPDCQGGMALYTAGSPGVEALEEDEPTESLFVLVDETPITLEVMEIADGLAFMFEGERLDAPHESALIGTTPELHADLDTQLLRPGGDLREVQATLLLKTSRETPYADSAPFTITFVPVLSQSTGTDE